MMLESDVHVRTLITVGRKIFTLKILRINFVLTLGCLNPKNVNPNDPNPDPNFNPNPNDS